MKHLWPWLAVSVIDGTCPKSLSLLVVLGNENIAVNISSLLSPIRDDVTIELGQVVCRGPCIDEMHDATRREVFDLPPKIWQNSSEPNLVLVIPTSWHDSLSVPTLDAAVLAIERLKGLPPKSVASPSEDTFVHTVERTRSKAIVASLVDSVSPRMKLFAVLAESSSDVCVVSSPSLIDLVKSIKVCLVSLVGSFMPCGLVEAKSDVTTTATLVATTTMLLDDEGAVAAGIGVILIGAGVGVIGSVAAIGMYVVRRRRNEMIQKENDANAKVEDIHWGMFQ